MEIVSFNIMYIKYVIYSIIFYVSYNFIYLIITDMKTALSIKQQENIENHSKLVEPFVLSEYFERIEKAFIDILQTQTPIDCTIVLWFGLDGLRMNEDGTFEWISRVQPKHSYQNTFYQMCQSAPILFDGLQNTQATQEQIFALKMQLDMTNFNIALQNQM